MNTDWVLCLFLAIFGLWDLRTRKIPRFATLAALAAGLILRREGMLFGFLAGALFFPLFLFSVVQLCCLGRTYPNFLAVRGISTLTGVTLIPVLFYTYTGVLGSHLPWADIAIFYISVIAAFLLCARKAKRVQKKQLTCPKWEERLLILSLLLFFAGFVFFTATPPDLGIFQSKA